MIYCDACTRRLPGNRCVKRRATSHTRPALRPRRSQMTSFRFPLVSVCNVLRVKIDSAARRSAQPRRFNSNQMDHDRRCYETIKCIFHGNPFTCVVCFVVDDVAYAVFFFFWFFVEIFRLSLVASFPLLKETGARRVWSGRRMHYGDGRTNNNSHY